MSVHQDVVGTLEPRSWGHGILLLIGAEMSERRKYLNCYFVGDQHSFNIFQSYRDNEFHFSNYTFPEQTALKQFAST